MPHLLRQVSFQEVNSPLLAYQRNVTSQFGEDGILQRVLSQIPMSAHYAVEFGAWDGRLYSNTWDLLHHHEWSGCLIEGNPERFGVLQTAYAHRPDVVTLNRLVSPTGPDGLDAILDEANAPKFFGLLSIDIDGLDYFVWEGLTRYRPTVVVIEFNPTVPNDVLFVQNPDPGVRQGCSLLALVELGRRLGYELCCATWCNGIFVDRSVYPLLGLRDNHINTLYRPAMDGRIFHGFDSYVHVIGMDRFCWRAHEPLRSSDFQVVPVAEQGFDT